MQITEQLEVLLAEDNQHDAELTIRALKKNNVVKSLVHVQDGAEALDFLFGMAAYEGNTNNQPRVILLDLKMPKIGGLEVLQKIKSDERTKSIPVVVLSSSKEHPDIQQAYALGANSYIVKPVEYEGFMEAILEIGMYWISNNELPE